MTDPGGTVSHTHGVDSEVGRLGTVMLHRPGMELRRITPRNRAELLFDAIPWVLRAQQEHDAFAAALRGRGVELAAPRLLSPLLAGSLERGLNVAEAMEARGYGRPGRTRAPRPPWTSADRAAVAGSVALVVVGALWL